MIELALSHLALTTRWLPTGTPGPAAVGEHIAATGVGRWWADRSAHPRAIAASCAGNVVLRGAADAVTPEALAPLAGTRIDAPASFLPALGAAFERLTPQERMIWTLQAEPQRPPVPRNVTIRRLEPADTDAVLALGPDASWLSASWGGPRGLAASGHAWAATSTGRVLSVACTYFRGTRYEDLAVYTVPDHRRHHLAQACVAALCTDITARGHVPTWNCPAHDRAGRLLAWTAGFRLVREYVQYAVGCPVVRERLSA
ncbi:GNAT family N-acetyltransferase [Streptomyces sp. NPDC002677]|uniref:GNAT family N-acetyltransferase n=1 Tax=Streptomyces sp. NPDC002677 TaxID=3154774 RepID=UPI00332764CD